MTVNGDCSLNNPCPVSRFGWLHFSFLPSLRSLYTTHKMGVTTTVESTTQPVRKNRRKMSKKAPQNVDQEMSTEDVEIADEAAVDVDPAMPTSFPDGADGDDELMIETDNLPSTSSAPAFPPLPASALQTTLKSETRRIPMPPHRMTPLKKDWINIFGPLTEMLGLQVRMNVQRRCVEIRVSIHHKC